MLASSVNGKISKKCMQNDAAVSSVSRPYVLCYSVRTYQQSASRSLSSSARDKIAQTNARTTNVKQA